MRRVCLAAALIAIPAATVVLDNPHARVFRTSDGSLAGVDDGPGVVISLDDGPGAKAGTAVWMDNVASRTHSLLSGSLIIVQPRRPAAPPLVAPPAGSAPGEASFTGMSFTPVFENDRVRVIRARMDVGAREGFHTHGSDTIVVHLSGGRRKTVLPYIDPAAELAKGQAQVKKNPKARKAAPGRPAGAAPNAPPKPRQSPVPE